MQQKRLTTMFLDEARKRLPEPFTKDELQNFVNEEQHALDAFYVAFEDRFRGSREDIYERLKVYIPVLEAAKVDREAQILDVGCGRGEWLELLHSLGYKAKGIDVNQVMLEQCRDRGLEVTESDVVQYLQSSPDNSLGVVTGFHIIEHLSFNDLMKLLSETSRVLKQGGMAIFETPNSHNLLVGGNNFYIDPTHRNPLPSELTKFLLEHIGFSSVKIINLHPFNDDIKLKGTDEIIQRFNDYFYGSQDYAVVGIKQ
jgi:O-antigen chain-terminating methyltransferase